jgi:arylsulfatase A-like enzyme
VAAAFELLEQSGELENTVVVMTGDHGMPFPRHKCNLYDSGTHVCLVARCGDKIKGGRRVTDFVSLADLAPTFLQAARVEIPQQMTGPSLVYIVSSDKSGRVDPSRDHVLTGRERHTVAQEPPSTGGYPARAIRADEFHSIRNVLPERWPVGAPEQYRDIDGSPSKTFLLEHRDDPATIDELTSRR